MKITTQELENIIKEEVQNVLEKNILGRFLDDEETGTDFGLDGFDWEAYGKQFVDMVGNGNDWLGKATRINTDLPKGALSNSTLESFLSKFGQFEPRHLKRLGPAGVVPGAYSKDGKDLADYLKNDDQFVNGAVAGIFNWGASWAHRDGIHLPKRLQIRFKELKPKGREMTARDVKDLKILEDYPDLKTAVNSIADNVGHQFFRGKSQGKRAAVTKAKNLQRYYNDELWGVKLLIDLHKEYDPKRSDRWPHLRKLGAMLKKDYARRIAEEFEETGIQEYFADGLQYIPGRLKYYLKHYDDIYKDVWALKPKMY